MTAKLSLAIDSCQIIRSDQVSSSGTVSYKQSLFVCVTPFVHLPRRDRAQPNQSTLIRHGYRVEIGLVQRVLGVADSVAVVMNLITQS